MPGVDQFVRFLVRRYFDRKKDTERTAEVVAVLHNQLDPIVSKYCKPFDAKQPDHRCRRRPMKQDDCYCC